MHCKEEAYVDGQDGYGVLGKYVKCIGEGLQFISKLLQRTLNPDRCVQNLDAQSIWVISHSKRPLYAGCIISVAKEIIHVK